MNNRIISLTREFSFEMAHALEGYDGLCRNIHGHSYKLFVTVCGEPNPRQGESTYGMVMDFGDLKKLVNELIVDRYDHTLLLRRSDKSLAVIDTLKQEWQRVELTDFQPTCELMILHFVELLEGRLPNGVALQKIRLYETANSSAEWVAPL